jgi:RNA polymerase sigma-70 factor (ECF subfamily)
MTWRSPTTSEDFAAAASFARLMGRARRRDEEALVTLYQRAYPVIYRYVMARLGRPDLVEDVVSEVFLEMVESITDIHTEHEAGFFAWMIRVSQGKISRALRHLKRQVTHHLPLPGSSTEEEEFLAEPMATDLLSDPAALQEWRDTLQELGLALGSLNREQQVVVIGRFLAGQSIEDLARALGKQSGAVRALQFRALGTLAERMGLKRTSARGSRGGRP